MITTNANGTAHSVAAKASRKMMIHCGTALMSISSHAERVAVLAFASIRPSFKSLPEQKP